jgi:mono/diheme cytochrome c family protein
LPLRYHDIDGIAQQVFVPSGAKIMRQVRVRIGSLVVFGLAAMVTTAEAQNQGACRQIRLVCEGAGFTQGAARDGVGLQVHCIMPIMQARAQPPTARKPLPRVSPLLVADCEASNPNFGQQRLPQIALAPPASPSPSRLAQAVTDPVPTGDIKAPPASDETSVHLKPTSGLNKVKSNCSACHSLDYIPMNSPFLSTAGWDAEVSKMIAAFGAAIDPKDAEAIADYLKENYGS